MTSNSPELALRTVCAGIVLFVTALVTRMPWNAALAQDFMPSTSDQQSDAMPPTAADNVALGDAAKRSSGELDIAPLDFCALQPNGDQAFQRQRVVMLDVAEDPSLRAAPEVELVTRGKQSVEVPRNVLRSIQPFGHAREVLLSVFPMKRLYMVLAPETPSSEFMAKQPIALTRAQALLRSDPHVAYSVECADWIAAPYMTRGQAVWKKVEREKVQVDSQGKSYTIKYIAWDVSVPMTARLEVYRRAGAQFVHHATLFATPRGTAADEALNWDDPSDVHQTVSVSAAPGCITAGMTRAEISSALTRCGGDVPRISPSQQSRTLGGNARASHYCDGLDHEVRLDESNMPVIARCELRVAAEYLAVDLQLQAKRMCGWRLFSPLVDVPHSAERGVTMGAHEGAERGSYYRAFAATGSGGCGDETAELGYGRLHSVGPGGSQGFKRPSVVHFQAGNPASGVRMEELAMHGLRLGVRPATALVLARGTLATAVAAGALMEGGYDLTRFIPWLDETWLKVDAGVLLGSETFVPMSVNLEGVSYVGDRLAIFADVGLAATVVSKMQGGDTVSGTATGGRVAVGVNYSMRPEWNLRLLAEARSGFGSTRLTSARDRDGIDAGSLFMPMISAAVTYTF